VAEVLPAAGGVFQERGSDFGDPLVLVLGMDLLLLPLLELPLLPPPPFRGYRLLLKRLVRRGMNIYGGWGWGWNPSWGVKGLFYMFDKGCISGVALKNQIQSGIVVGQW
jgi:hypothetical protein